MNNIWKYLIVGEMAFVLGSSGRRFGRGRGEEGVDE